MQKRYVNAIAGLKELLSKFYPNRALAYTMLDKLLAVFSKL